MSGIGERTAVCAVAVGEELLCVGLCAVFVAIPVHLKLSAFLPSFLAVVDEQVCTSLSGGTLSRRHIARCPLSVAAGFASLVHIVGVGKE